MNDQATQLRKLVRGYPGQPRNGSCRAGGGLALAPGPSARSRPALDRHPPTPAPPPQLACAIAVTSGKGGVGKTNLAVNLAVTLARLGRRVCLLDADLGLANADVLCGLTPRVTLEHVVAGRCRLAEAMLLAPGGFRLIPGACGVAQLADLDRRGRVALLGQLAALERVADQLIIDTSAGLGRNVRAFAAAAGRVVVVATPEPTAITDAYGTIKALVRRSPRVRITMVVNMASSEEEGLAVFRRMDRVSRAFLGRPLEYAGSLPTDATVREAVRQRVPFALYGPESPATRALGRLAHVVIGLPSPAPGPAGGGFFARLLERLSRK